MNSRKIRHGIEIAGLVLLTVLVILAVIYTQRGHFLISAPEESQTLDDSASDTLSQSDAAPDESTTEWLPVIEYDAYTPSEIEPSNFRNTVIIGNSQAQALGNFGLVKNADFVTKVGLSINRVLSDPDGSPPIERLRGKTYSKAVFVFGENELGWPYPANFIKIYKQVIARVRALNPGIEVYVQAVFPVTKEVSETSKTGITNENVLKFNAAIETMCDEIDATFMPVTDAFRDENGALPEGVAHDGVHFGYDLCKVWAGDMSAYIGANTAKTTTETTTETTTMTATEPETALQTTEDSTVGLIESQTEEEQ